MEAHDDQQGLVDLDQRGEVINGLDRRAHMGDVVVEAELVGAGWRSGAERPEYFKRRRQP